MRYHARPVPYKNKICLEYLDDGFCLNDVFYSNNVTGKVLLIQRLYSFGIEFTVAMKLVNGYSLVPVTVLTR